MAGSEFLKVGIFFRRLQPDPSRPDPQLCLQPEQGHVIGPGGVEVEALVSNKLPDHRVLVLEGSSECIVYVRKYHGCA